MLAKNTKFLVVCNWKMYLPYHMACTWAARHFEDIGTELTDSNIAYIVCPSYDALASIAPSARKHNILLGAQDCSGHASGAFTGQTAATSLRDIGVTYCIVGHSEARTYLHQSSYQIAAKMEQLLTYNITPIVCIGESAEEYQQGKALAALEKQLEPLNTIFAKTNKTIYLAYEPIWSIGTGTIPSPEHLAMIHKRCRELSAACQKDIPLLYGGSVDSQNILDIVHHNYFDGVLIGKASTDFQKMKTIVSLLKDVTKK